MLKECPVSLWCWDVFCIEASAQLARIRPKFFPCHKHDVATRVPVQAHGGLDSDRRSICYTLSVTCLCCKPAASLLKLDWRVQVYMQSSAPNPTQPAHIPQGGLASSVLFGEGAGLGPEPTAYATGAPIRPENKVDTTHTHPQGCHGFITVHWAMPDVGAF